LLLISVFQKSFIKISNKLSRNFQDFKAEDFYNYLRMRETIAICGWEAFDQNSNNGTLVFLIQINKHFTQIPAKGFGKRKPGTKLGKSCICRRPLCLSGIEE